MTKSDAELTREYEDAILPLPNAVGVEYDSDTDTVIALVKRKVPETQLQSHELVDNAVSEETDVIETGEIKELSAHKGAFRPIKAGISEGPVVKNMAGTGGPLARVTNPNSTNWSPLVEEGEIVRISNAHVYAESRAQPGLYGDVISQPAKLDGGSSNTTVGKLVGYLPMNDGITIDAAARTTNEHDRAAIHGVGSERLTNADENVPAHPTGIRREYSLKGKKLTKSGRTSDVSSADVIATSASVNVSMGDRVVLFRDQLLTNHMSEPGDSGSPSTDPVGALAGLLFAGSDTITVHNKIANVERVLGVEFLTAEDDEARRPEVPTPEEPEEEPEPAPIEDPVEEPTEEPEPEPAPQHLTIGPASLFESVEYSFDISEDSDISFGGRSTSQVGNRVNGWVNRWTNTYTIHGHLTDQAIPPGTTVSLNHTTVEPEALVDYSKELAGVEPSTPNPTGDGE